MQIPAGKIYDLLLGIALRMRKGAEHAGTGVVHEGGECAFSVKALGVVRMNFGAVSTGYQPKNVIPAKAGIHADDPK
jgi:hypothetical protein